MSSPDAAGRPAYQPKIIGFLCNWCSYAGADLAGTSRMQYTSNIRIVRVRCSGRVSPELVLKTFHEGADGILVLGCHIGDCHYIDGNHRTSKRIPILRQLLAYAGIDPNRLRLEWVSAAEGDRFAHIVNDFTDQIRQLGPIKTVMVT
jgi:F420-non-reducing hydrogenase iron-sulfur subunit